MLETCTIDSINCRSAAERTIYSMTAILMPASAAKVCYYHTSAILLFITKGPGKPLPPRQVRLLCPGIHKQ